ncbi:PREDICTED: uncharacterized protein LOC101299333 [Fragaria vesca subsp. vesca]|uniref:uncharacterized protein LOC101299333 n=1 Tax=Fragaria vesca subsp. vesca TaxID=101020 RepID=UPI0002C36FA0|nr:PREDICTED: uncharacterized protein LOC101299333 [Fragaria vesca subsp. vesca]
MGILNKLEFVALEVSGRNYLKWTQDVKLHLTAQKMRTTSNADNIAPEDMKARAMIFLRKHMEEALTVEYLAEEDPRSLWVALEERFNHQKAIYLPQGRHDWQNIRFQDFKTVNEYNSEICRIRSLLKFCGEERTEADLLEKTLSTFPPCMNDQARPIGARAAPLPEANIVAHRGNNRVRRNMGRGKGRRNGPRNGPYDREPQRNGPRGRGGRGQGPRGRNRNAPAHQAQVRENAGPARRPQNQHNLCYRCGGTDHWSRTCRATNEKIEEYHARRGTQEANLVEEAVPINTTLEIADFQAANEYIED